MTGKFPNILILFFYTTIDVYFPNLIFNNIPIIHLLTGCCVQGEKFLLSLLVNTTD